MKNQGLHNSPIICSIYRLVRAGYEKLHCSLQKMCKIFCILGIYLPSLYTFRMNLWCKTLEKSETKLSNDDALTRCRNFTSESGTFSGSWGVSTTGNRSLNLAVGKFFRPKRVPARGGGSTFEWGLHHCNAAEGLSLVRCLQCLFHHSWQSHG